MKLQFRNAAFNATTAGLQVAVKAKKNDPHYNAEYAVTIHGDTAVIDLSNFRLATADLIPQMVHTKENQAVFTHLLKQLKKEWGVNYLSIGDVMVEKAPDTAVVKSAKLGATILGGVGMAYGATMAALIAVNKIAGAVVGGENA